MQRRHELARFRLSEHYLSGCIGGWEEYPVVRRPADWDTDRDGMPDEWEKKRGLDPSDATDGNLDRDGDGYTNLEEYLGWLTGEFKAEK